MKTEIIVISSVSDPDPLGPKIIWSCGSGTNLDSPLIAQNLEISLKMY